MNRLSLIFSAPGKVIVQEESLGEPELGQVLVETSCSGISPGTEMLIYRGQFPPEMLLDETITLLSTRFQYPLKYGYCSAGQILRTGPGIDASLAGKRVFSFHPHESHFICRPDELLIIPLDIPVEEAVFLPTMETAVNFLLDGNPMLGEKVIVMGQGIVGLITAGLLAFFPLSQLITLDRFPARRQVSLGVGAQASFDPDEPGLEGKLRQALQGGADLVYEVSGAPQALDQAIKLASFSGRVVVGSWYGQKRASLDLGGTFHRSRIRLISSQVSTLAPELTGRWNKERRFSVAWDMIRRLRPARFITQRIPIAEAERAYQLIDQSPGETLQVILNYQK